METLIQHQYEELFNCLPDGAIVIDSRGMILIANQEAASILGYNDPAEMKGVPVSTLYSNPTDHDTLLSVLGHRGMIEKGVYDWKQKNGQPVLVELRAAPLRNQEGHVTGIQGIFKDITKKLESQLAQQQTLEETTARSIDADRMTEMINFYLTRPSDLILQGVAHNMNTPLGNIRGRAELIIHNIEKFLKNTGTALPDPDKELLRKQIKGIQDIVSQVDRSVEIIKSFTDKIAADSEKQAGDTDVNGVIRMLMHYMETSLYIKHRVRKNLELDPANPRAYISPADLAMVLYHLTVHCLKASAGKPDVNLDIKTYSRDNGVLIDFSGSAERPDESEMDYYLNANTSTRFDIPDEANFSAYDIEVRCARNLLEAAQGSLEIIPDAQTLFRVTLPS